MCDGSRCADIHNDSPGSVTNGLYRATTHRVVNPDSSGDARYSLPYFVHPSEDVDLTPLPHCVAKTGGQAQFPNLTAGQILAQRLVEIGLGTT